MVIDYLKIYTFLSKEEIEELEVKNNEHPELREAHKALAKSIITFLHGEEEYDKALRISEALFSGDIKNLSYDEINDAFKDVPSFELKNETLIDMLVNNKITSSKREAREFLSAGSISLNGEKVTDENMMINSSIAIDGKAIIIRKGKKKYYFGKF